MSMFRPMAAGLRAAVLAASALTAALPGHAVPSFARQTGQDCAACHIGGYGPQLTPYGIRFKIGGYVDGNGQSKALPLSGMVVGSFNRTAKAQDAPPANGYKTNNNLALDEASLFIAGQLAGPLGAFVQVTYDGIARTTALDQVDLRYSHATDVRGKDLVLGISVNNNPSVQDPFNTLPAWGFPYTSTALGFAGPEAATMVNGGLSQRVLGATAYAFYDNSWYGEVGSYRSLSRSLQSRLGQDIAGDPGVLGGDTLYWRLAWFKDLKSQSFSAGVFGLGGSLRPDRAAGTPVNRYGDVGVDAQYQFLGTRAHVVTVQASLVHERQRRDALIAAAEADNAVGHLREAKLNASYHFRQTWGVSAGLFRTSGDGDATLYSGSLNGKPDTSGRVLQLDWTPFGKEDAWGAPWANLRIGAQYTAYTRYNGGTANYDGSGRNASDNNSLFVFAWTAF
jgi:hypothetical protein